MLFKAWLHFLSYKVTYRKDFFYSQNMSLYFKQIIIAILHKYLRSG